MHHVVEAFVCVAIWVTGGWPRHRWDVCWKCPEYCRIAIKCNYILMSFLLVYNFSLNFCWLDGLWPTVTTEQRLVVRKKFVLTWAHSVSEAKLGGVTPGACMRSNVPVALVSLLRSWTPTSHACWKAVLFSEVKQNLANARVGLYRRRLWGLQAMLLQRPHQALHSKILHIHKSAFWNFKRCKCVLFPLFEIPVCSSDC